MSRSLRKPTVLHGAEMAEGDQVTLPDFQVDLPASERLGGGVVRGWATLPVQFA